MRALLDFGAALKLDREIQDRFRLPGDLLMEAASIGMTAWLLANPSLVEAMRNSGVPAAALCGRGSNGGDALAVLRHLAFDGWTGLVAIVADQPEGACGRRLAEAKLAGIAILHPGDPDALRAVEAAGIILDGIAGIGFHGKRRGAFLELAGLVSARRGNIVAIDVPSGLGEPEDFGSDPEPPLAAVATLCVEPLKAELYYPGWRRFSGNIVPIGGVFPRSSGSGSRIALLAAEDLDARLPVIDPDCHKGSRGALAVYAGSIGSTGAAALCARAGSAGGAGSVTLVVCDAIVDICSTLLTAQMVRPVSDPGSRRFNAVVAGPGWGTEEANVHALDRLWDAEVPLVLDADAIRIVAAGRRPPRRFPLFMTPHPGEFALLATRAAGKAFDDPAALELARRRIMYDTAAVLEQTAVFFGAIIVLKGSVTWIGGPDGRLSVWDGREPAMATAGSGDVLAGLLGSFLARGIEARDAAEAAVIVHGLSGRLAARSGFFEATELIPAAAALAYRRGGDGNQG
jgi:ADP-dependent NAD(P)H-hydrate dehydratase / NAD(P)H-hydrate epimerase